MFCLRKTPKTASLILFFVLVLVQVNVLEGELAWGFQDDVKPQEETLRSYLAEICVYHGYCGIQLNFIEWDPIDDMLDTEGCSPAYVPKLGFPLILLWSPALPHFTENEWRAILAHEIAHIVLKKQHSEFEADEFGAKIFNKYFLISALQKRINGQYPFCNHTPEALILKIEDRIRNLQTLEVKDP